MPVPEKLILLLEDSADDVFFFKRALKDARLRNPVHAVPDVHEATCYLEGKGQYADRSVFPLPSIAVIDLHIPGSNSFDFLKWLSECPEFRQLHIIVVSGVERLQEVSRAYQMGASSFLTKPVKAEDLRNLANAFPAPWT